MNRGIAVAGNIVVDTVKHITSYPPRSELTTVTRMARSLGGSVCNVGIDLARMAPDIPLFAIGRAGEDANGEFVRQCFAQHPSLDASRVIYDGITSFTDVMTEPDGGRTFFHFRGANARLDVDDFAFDKLDADILHIAYILLLDALDAPDDAYGTRLCRVLDGARRRGMLTSIDVVTEDGDRFARLVPPALALSDLCIINETEAARSTDIATRTAAGALCPDGMRAACQKLIALGVKRWAVVHAPEAACGMARGDAPIVLPSMKLPPGFIKSSVGAGDAFASGVLMGCYRGWPLEKAMLAATHAAAWSLSGEGGTDAMMPYDDIAARLEAMGCAQL